MELPTPPLYRRWSVILAGVIGLAAITALLGWRGLQQVPPPSTDLGALPATTVSSAPTTTPPSSIGPTSKPDDILWEATDGDSVSEGFRAPPVWRIEWTFDCSNFANHGGGNFKITGNGAFERIQIENVAIRANGTRTFRRAGFGRLFVESVCERWTVRVLSG
jgi:hypothetical protein